MIKEIPLKGITTTPDNYLSKDGDLQYALNCASQDGSLTPPPHPSTLLYVPEDYELIYVHETGLYTNYIFWHEYTNEEGDDVYELHFSGEYTTSLLYWSKLYAYAKNSYDKAPQSEKQQYVTQMNSYAGTISSNMNNIRTIPIKGNTKPTAITSVGNALCVRNEAGLQYCICLDGINYKILPSSFPQISFKTTLRGTYELSTDNEGVYLTSQVKKESFHMWITNHFLFEEESWDNKMKHLGIVNASSLGKDVFEAGDYNLKFTPDQIWNSHDFKENKACYVSIYIITPLSSSNPSRVIQLYDTNESVGYKNEYFTCYPTQEDEAPCTALFCDWEFNVPFHSDTEFSSFYVVLTCMKDTFKYDFTYEFGKNLYSIEGISLSKTDDFDSYKSISAGVKKFIDQKATSKGMFMYPFFLRLAFKTQDNNYVSLSAPVLLIPNSGQSPMVRIDNYNSFYGAKMYISAFVAYIQLKIPNLTEYSNWSDIISKVVVAITRPIYSYNQSVENADDLYSQMTLADNTNDDSNFCIGNNAVKIEHLLFTDKVQNKTLPYKINLPLYSSAENKMFEDPNFYIIKEIPLQDIIDGKYSTPTKIDISDINLNNLVNNRILPDDYSSLVQYYPQTLHSMNERLHIGNYKQSIFNGWNISNQLQLDGNNGIQYKCIVKIKQDHNTYNVCTPYVEENSGLIRYFAYPNINAVSATIYKKDSTGYYKCEIPLKTHPTRNEAYWFDNYKSISNWTFIGTQSDNAPAISSVVYSDRSNCVKISETNNPLIFTNLRTYNFNSPVAAMTTAVQALSTGQKGEFDLYVFTLSDGVWSLKINSEGGYSKQIPVTRDTITNPKSICQLDNSVLFVTDRGIMELHGSESQCISEDLMRKETIALTNKDLPLIHKILFEAKDLDLYDAAATIQDQYGDPITLNGQPVKGDGKNPDPLDFRTYIQNAYISYDYRNQRIVVYNPDKTYAYNFNITSKLWTLLPSYFSSPVNSYPECLIQTNDERVIDLSGDSHTDNSWDSTQQKAFILTRPFSLDLPNEFKIIDQIRINGTGYLQGMVIAKTDEGNDIIEPSHVKQILYGSNDLLTWHCISSSVNNRISGKSGTPYRFFRLAILSSLTASETLDSISISYRIKDENTKLF